MRILSAFFVFSLSFFVPAAFGEEDKVEKIALPDDFGSLAPKELADKAFKVINRYGSFDSGIRCGDIYGDYYCSPEEGAQECREKFAEGIEAAEKTKYSLYNARKALFTAAVKDKSLRNNPEIYKAAAVSYYKFNGLYEFEEIKANLENYEKHGGRLSSGKDSGDMDKMLLYILKSPENLTIEDFMADVAAGEAYAGKITQGYLDILGEGRETLFGVFTGGSMRNECMNIVNRPEAGFCRLAHENMPLPVPFKKKVFMFDGTDILLWNNDAAKVKTKTGGKNSDYFHIYAEGAFKVSGNPYICEKASKIKPESAEALASDIKNSDYDIKTDKKAGDPVDGFIRDIEWYSDYAYYRNADIFNDGKPERVLFIRSQFPADYAHPLYIYMTLDPKTMKPDFLFSSPHAESENSLNAMGYISLIEYNGKLAFCARNYENTEERAYVFSRDKKYSKIAETIEKKELIGYRNKWKKRIFKNGRYAAATSFDCSAVMEGKTGNDTERALCSEPFLRLGDRVLSETYRYKRRQFSGTGKEEGRKKLTASQKEWIKKRDECGGNADCIADMLFSRIYFLEQF